MNYFRNLWLRFSMKYLGATYYVDPASAPPRPTTGIHAHGHAWWGRTYYPPKEADAFGNDVMSRCPCGARLYWRKHSSEPLRHDPEALVECPVRDFNDEERRRIG